MLGLVGIVIILALVALLVIGTIAVVGFLSEPTNAGDPASGAGAVVAVLYDVVGRTGGA